MENAVQQRKPLFPVQRPRRRAQNLKVVEGVRFNPGKPRTRRFDVFRFYQEIQDAGNYNSL